MSDHIGDDAALYALGMLDPTEREAVDTHVAGCDACTRLLGAAEDDVARLVDAQSPPSQAADNLIALPVRRGRPFARVAAAALAAVLVIGIVPSTYLWEQNRAMHEAMVAETAAMNQLASGPFHTVAFATMPQGSNARVMYAPDGSWYVIVVRGASKALGVAWMHDGERTMLGMAQPRGDVAMLYLPRSHRMDRLALVDGEAVVAEAQLAY